MTSKTVKPAPLATETGFDVCSAWQSSNVEFGTKPLRLQAETLRQRFGMTPIRAQAVAGLAFAGVRP